MRGHTYRQTHRQMESSRTRERHTLKSFCSFPNDRNRDLDLLVVHDPDDDEDKPRNGACERTNLKVLRVRG